MDSSKDIEINIINLLYRIFKHWRMLIVSMLIGAVLFDLYSYYKDTKAASNTKQLIEDYNAKMASGDYDNNGNTVVKLPEFEKNLSDRQISEVNNLLATYRMYQTPYADTVEYVNNSMLMKIDSKATPTITLQYLIDTHYTVEYPEITKKDYTEDILNSIDSLLLNEELLGDVSSALSDEDFELNEAYASELFSSEVISDTYIIKFYGRDKADVQRISTLVKTQMENVFSDLKKTYGDFDSSLLCETYTESYNSSILEIQRTKADTLNTIYKNAQGLITNLTDDQKAYFYALLNNEDTVSVELPIETDGGEDSLVDPTKLEIPAIRKINIKYIIIGVFVGLFVASIWIAFITILGGRLLTNNDMENMYCLSQMGVWKVTSEPMGIFGFIDRWLIRILDGKGSQFSSDESLEMIAAGVRISAKKNGWDKVYLTSTSNDALTQNALSDLTDKLKKVIGTVSFGKSVVYDPESLIHLCDSDAVVLIEKVDTSRMSEIQAEYNLCKKYEIPIIGYVTLK